MKKHSFQKSGTNFYKNGAGGGAKAIYKFYKKTDVLETGVVPNSCAGWFFLLCFFLDSSKGPHPFPKRLFFL